MKLTNLPQMKTLETIKASEEPISNFEHMKEWKSVYDSLMIAEKTLVNATGKTEYVVSMNLMRCALDALLAEWVKNEKISDAIILKAMEQSEMSDHMVTLKGRIITLLKLGKIDAATENLMSELNRTGNAAVHNLDIMQNASEHQAYNMALNSYEQLYQITDRFISAMNTSASAGKQKNVAGALGLANGKEYASAACRGITGFACGIMFFASVIVLILAFTGGFKGDLQERDSLLMFALWASQGLLVLFGTIDGTKKTIGKRVVGTICVVLVNIILAYLGSEVFYDAFSGFVSDRGHGYLILISFFCIWLSLGPVAFIGSTKRKMGLK